MKKEYCAAALLLLLLIGSILNIRFLDSVTLEIQQGIDRAVAAGDPELLDAAAERWLRLSAYTHTMLRYTQTDEITDAFYELREDLAAKDEEGTASSHKALQTHLTRLRDTEHITFDSIF